MSKFTVTELQRIESLKAMIAFVEDPYKAPEIKAEAIATLKRNLKSPDIFELLKKAEELLPENTTQGHMLCEEIRQLTLEIEGE